MWKKKDFVVLGIGWLAIFAFFLLAIIRPVQANEVQEVYFHHIEQAVSNCKLNGGLQKITLEEHISSRLGSWNTAIAHCKNGARFNLDITE